MVRQKVSEFRQPRKLSSPNLSKNWSSSSSREWGKCLVYQIQLNIFFLRTYTGGSYIKLIELLNRYLWISDKHNNLQVRAIVRSLVDPASHKYILHELFVSKMANFASQDWPKVGVMC